MSRIRIAFERLHQQGRKALIPFITAGDPDPQATVPLMHGLVAGGADIIELGVPFSDPMADGPTIQRASERALKWGISLRTVLGIAHQFRKDDPHTPVVLMGYANPIEAMGVDAFCKSARESGVDGVLVVDYPPEEARDFALKVRAHGIDPIFLLAPTSAESRYRDVAEVGSGYIYYVSLKGVTGAGHLDVSDVAARIPRIRAQVGMPVGVGFGIRDAATAKQLAAIADAVVIGSRIVEEIENSPREQAVARVTEFLRGIREALDETVGKGRGGS
ncbi:MAG TPA: tryptophan synthase subunit alpha [Rhodocyclaceae bacterium]|nr:tryptophan synthase subunit alpha [Rhodocyclaceae bacterium]HNA02315.1 tryptophan synthase subunit alpha [Rhodocyclaceae bacterium]HNB78267.1 tryptophan synthase subunit alpha [Rhodocyclaceae bacterium]HNC61622.1 tryptophan synthase subunit alpha [Rhodocyclaceae bacterium]HNH98251.1 tryptophan synthase subunit alpha [Rhodocyclaceae bacterium]